MNSEKPILKSFNRYASFQLLNKVFIHNSIKAFYICFAVQCYLLLFENKQKTQTITFSKQC